MAKLSTVAAERDTAILNKAGRGKTLHVLLRILRPALSHLRTARLVRQLNSEHVIALWISNQVDNGHVHSNLLLLGNQEDGKSIGAQSGFDIGQTERIKYRPSVGLEACSESIDVLLASRMDECRPSLFSLELRDASPINNTALLTVDCLVTFLVAELAFERVCRAVSSGVAFDATRIASSGKLTLNARVRAVSLVVANFTTVLECKFSFCCKRVLLEMDTHKTLAGEASSGRLVGAPACGVTRLVAAVRNSALPRADWK